MSLLLFFTGVGNVGRRDRHDGGFSKKEWERYQEQLRKRREQLERSEEADQKRKLELRKELTKLYRGLPEEQKRPIESTNQVQSKSSRSVPEFGVVLSALSEIGASLKSLQVGMLNEYKEIELRERLRLEAEEEEELEMILTAIL